MQCARERRSGPLVARASVMATDAALGPYARASALSCKAQELEYRGHVERAGDKFREALAAARAVGTEDCLVTAMLTVTVADDALSLVGRLANERHTVDRPSTVAKLRELAEALACVAAVARRRRAAGTHQPAEQAWFEAHHVAVVSTANAMQVCPRAKFFGLPI